MILDDEESSPTSERSPLKSPSSPVTARYDSTNGSNTQQLSPPPYFTQGGSLNSGPSSPHHSYHSHPHPHHPHPHSIPHPHSPAFAESHSRNPQEERAIRHSTLHRFFGALFVA